jgi:lipoic acid synthetase
MMAKHDTEYSNMRKPPWLKIKPNFGPVYTEVKALLKDLELHTVCQEASCPNIGECFSARTATFIILGDKCTRNCRFCDVKPGRPEAVDCDEPSRVAEAVSRLSLKYAVITSVTRDDLPDGGANIFAETIRRIREAIPECGVEVLIPDMKGMSQALDIVIEAGPDVLAHNIETVPNLYKTIRPKARYKRSLDVLKYAADNGDGTIVKSGIMIGLGENLEQVKRVLDDVADTGCRIFTIGQYLSPSRNHAPVKKFYTPEEFESLKVMGEKAGINLVVSGPLVRSSYLAHSQTKNYFAKIKINQNS